MQMIGVSIPELTRCVPKFRLALPSIRYEILIVQALWKLQTEQDPAAAHLFLI